MPGGKYLKTKLSKDRKHYDPKNILQGGSITVGLSFVAFDLGVLPLLPGCFAHSARFPPAQAESGRESNIAVISTQNIGLRADA